MTTPTTDTTRKLLDVEKILAVLDAEQKLVHGILASFVPDDRNTVDDTIRETWAPEIDRLKNDDTLPSVSGPLALANCSHVGHCAMGALLYATGKLSFRALDQLDGEADAWHLPIVKLLYDEYGIQRFHAKQIIGANDDDSGHDDALAISVRRERVKERVRALAERQQANPDADLDKCQNAEEDYFLTYGSFPKAKEHFTQLALTVPDIYDW